MVSDNAGQFIFEAGGEQHRMTPGMSILVPRLVPHRFQNIGSSTGRRPDHGFAGGYCLRETSSTHPWFLWIFLQHPMARIFQDNHGPRLSLRLSSEFPSTSPLAFSPPIARHRHGELGSREFREILCRLLKRDEILPACAHASWARIGCGECRAIGFRDRVRFVGGEVVPEEIK